MAGAAAPVKVMPPAIALPRHRAFPRPVLTAYLADLHANREALQACLDRLARLGPDRLVVLGDLVGYGADPEWVVETVMTLAGRGAVVLKGNHDWAASGRPHGMTGAAAASMAWTRPRLSPAAVSFLDALPLTHAEEGVLHVHAEASNPGRWLYVDGPWAARRSLAATGAWLTVCGHVHRPALYALGRWGRVSALRPEPERPNRLDPGRRWLATMGSVGQPRDGDPAARLALYDPARGEIAWHRVPYDVEAAAAKVRAAGLPESLAERLLAGR